MKDQVTCVVNYYNPGGASHFLRSSCIFAVECLLKDSEGPQVILVDGAGIADKCIKTYCESREVAYLTLNKKLTFAQGYNYGAQFCTTEWICLCASDIYLYPGFFTAAFDFIRSNPSLNVGCIVPTLSFSAYPSQMRRPSRPTKRLLMTINTNLMTYQAFQDIGGVPEIFSGNYNDVAMALKLRSRDLDIYQLPSLGLHWGRATVNINTEVNLKKDRQTFRLLYPHLCCNGSLWDIQIHKLVNERWRFLMYCIFKLRHIPGLKDIYHFVCSRV